MMQDHLIVSILGICILLLVAVFSSIFLKRLRFPYTIGLVIVGLLLAMIMHYSPELSSTVNTLVFHEIIYYILLPILIFDASINMDSRLLVRNIIPVLILAGPGLIISLLIVGFIVNLTTPLMLGSALLFGALISATDPVAVIALFKEIGAPKRLTMLVDGESIFNDATAIVAFNIILAVLMSGHAPGAGTLFFGILDFIWVFAGGAIIGVIMGYFAVSLMSITKKDPMVILVLTTVLAFSSFIIADHFLHVSGVMSVLGAGITVNYYRTTKLNFEVKDYMVKFWEYASFLANSFIFIVLGIVEWRMFDEFQHTEKLLLYFLYAIVAVILARAVVVYGIAPIIKLFPKQRKIDIKYQTIVFWGGLRGAVPLALAFSLTSDVPGSKLILQLTLGVVLFTLLVNGLSTKLLINAFKLNKISVFESLLCLQARLQTLIKGKNFLKNIKKHQFAQDSILDSLIASYDKDGENIVNQLMLIQDSGEFTPAILKKMLWLEAIAIERQTYKRILGRGLISDQVFRTLDINTDFEIEQVKDSQTPSTTLYTMPAFSKLKKKTASLIEKIFHASSLAKTLRFNAVLEEYEMVYASICAYARVAESLDSLPLIYANQKEIVNDCKTFYKERSNAAKTDIEKLSKYISMLKVQTRYLKRAALHEEMETVEKLHSGGFIPLSVSKILEDEINLDLSKK